MGLGRQQLACQPDVSAAPDRDQTVFWYFVLIFGMLSALSWAACPAGMPHATHGLSGMSVHCAILTYHSLDQTGSVISIRPDEFRRQMETLAASATEVVPLSQILNRPGAVAITFDDGFANFADFAVPVLERLSLPATVFVVSGHCGGHNDWPGQPASIPRLPLMSWNTLRHLPDRIALGAHTVTHPDLSYLDDRRITREVDQSRMEIEQNTGRAVEAFAYPYGAADARAATAVRTSFRIGCGTRLRFAHAASDPALLPRLDVYYLKSAMWFRNPLGIPNTMYIGLRRWLREARARRSNHHPCT
jgi:peptidoglycan/xylan/chitin deacetylase (PgdA/CDA1 family)